MFWPQSIYIYIHLDLSVYLALDRNSAALVRSASVTDTGTSSSSGYVAHSLYLPQISHRHVSTGGSEVNHTPNLLELWKI